jgi:hypothetical protein
MPGIEDAFEIGVLFFLRGPVGRADDRQAKIAHLPPKGCLRLGEPGTRRGLREILGMCKNLLRG